MKFEKNRPIAVEDLLRLKRVERPPTEFWSEFDRQLRAKQLAALVSRRPWWHPLSAVFFKVSRYPVPLGAAAVLAVTFFSVRDYRAASPAQLADHSPQVARSEARVVVSATSVEMKSPAHIVSPVLSGEDARAENNSESAPVASHSTRAGVEVSATSDITPMVPLLGVTLVDAASDKLVTTSVPLIARAGANPVNEAPKQPSLLAAMTVFESRTSPARAVVEPLQQMTLPGERRRPNLLTAMVSLASTEAPVRTTDRVANRITEDRLYDQIHRFGARGPGVSMKF